MDFNQWQESVNKSLVSHNSNIDISDVDSTALAQAFANEVSPLVMAKLIQTVGKQSNNTVRKKLANPGGISAAVAVLNVTSAILAIAGVINVIMGAISAGKATPSPSVNRANEVVTSEFSNALIGSIWSWTLGGTLTLLFMAAFLFALAQSIKEYGLQHS